MRPALIFILLGGACVPEVAQTTVALDVSDKLRYHAEKTYSASSLALTGAKAGLLQMTDSPWEWGQGASGYSKRAGSSLASSGIRNGLAFGLDAALHQDPRYYRSADTGVWRRIKHAMRGTILTRTDSGAETLSTWRLGSAYGAAFISQQWYPDRLRTVRHGLASGTTKLGFDLAKNVGAEFWPDVKKKLRRR